MSITSALSSLKSSRGDRARKATRRHRRLTSKRRAFFERLEDRRLLATLTTELISGTDGGDGSGNSWSNIPSVSDNGQYVAFRSAASDLVAGDTNNTYDVFVRDVTNGTTTLVSTDSSGTQGNSASYDPSISDDGRYVAFVSYATNLVSGDTNGQYDIFVKDLQTGTTTLVSTDSSANQSNSQSWEPSISGDGQFVAFSSYANNLVSGDTNGQYDIFVKNLQTGTTTRASVSTAGVQANTPSNQPSISDDGQYVAFYSHATTLDAADTDTIADIYVRDLVNNTTTLVSTSSADVKSNNQSYNPSISGDGQHVAFRSHGNNLDGGDTDNRGDIFVKDLQSGATTLVSTSSAGVKSNSDSYNPSISDNGRYVSFVSDASNLVSGDTNNVWDVFIKDRQASTTTLVSVDSSGNQANNSSFETNAAMSGNGQFVTFWSRANNLDGIDFNNTDDVFIRDLANATTTLVSERDPDISIPGNNSSSTGRDIAVSEGGRFVAFQTYATNLFSDANGYRSDIVVRDRDDGSIILVSSSSAGVQGNNHSFDPSISDDGRYVAFRSHANNLVSGDTNGQADIFVKDLQTGTTTLVSTDSSANQSNSHSWEPSISGDGQFVAFSSYANNLVSGDTNGQYDIFVKNLQTGTTTRASVSTAGVQANTESNQPSISDDGQYVAFYSHATTLDAADTDTFADIYVRDLVNNTTTLVSTSSADVKSNSSSYNPSISGDGQYVAFRSHGNTLDAGDTDNRGDIFVKDLQSGATTLVSTSSAGVKSNSYSYNPSISDNGRYVAFQSSANNLVSGDTNYHHDVFVKDLQTGGTTLVSNTPDGGQATGYYYAYQPSISGDGGYVAFTAYNLLESWEGYQVYLSAPDNAPPVVEDQSFDVAENTTTVGTVAASDPDDGETLIYEITGGADAALFDIDTSTGALTFKDAPDYELPSDDGGDNVYDLEVTVTDSNGASDSGNMTINVLNEANVTGFVFADVDNDGMFDVEDAPLANVEVTLIEAGVDEVFGTTDDETFTTMTDNDGFYGFEDVAAGNVRIIESGAPVDLADGVDTPNGATDLDTVNDQFTIDMPRTDVNGMNFAEQADGGGLNSGDTATIGYWHNRNGQTLIDKLDENDALTAWLLDNFGNIFDQADFDEYGGSVSDFYKEEFFKQKLKGTPKVDAQFMAVAFATFATSSNLSNGAAAGFGFTVTDSGIGTTMVNVGSNGAAFGVADNTDMTIMALLLATNNLTGSGADLAYDGAQDLDNDGVVDDTVGSLGTLDDFEKTLRVMANEVYTAINEGGDI